MGLKITSKDVRRNTRYSIPALTPEQLGIVNSAFDDYVKSRTLDFDVRENEWKRFASLLIKTQERFRKLGK